MGRGGVFGRAFQRAFTGVGLLIFSACGSGDGTRAGGLSESLTYSHTANGCSTGEHTFSSTDGYCAGLQDETLNRGCALESRKLEFQRACPGRTWQVTHIGTVACGSASCDGATEYCLTSYAGSADQPMVPARCIPVPGGFDYDDADASCELLRKDAQRVFAGADNCGQATYCTKHSDGRGYSLSCRVF
jgi:hypothetical protein